MILIKSWDWANTLASDNTQSTSSPLHVPRRSNKTGPLRAETLETVKLDCNIPYGLQTWVKPSGNNAAVVSCVGFLLKGLPLSSTPVTAFNPVKLNRSPTPRWVTHDYRRKRGNTGFQDPILQRIWLKNNILLSTFTIASLNRINGFIESRSTHGKLSHQYLITAHSRQGLLLHALAKQSGETRFTVKTGSSACLHTEFTTSVLKEMFHSPQHEGWVCMTSTGLMISLLHHHCAYGTEVCCVGVFYQMCALKCTRRESAKEALLWTSECFLRILKK